MTRKNEVRSGFSEIEVKILDWIVVNLQRGSLGGRGLPIVRRPEFASLAQKIAAMKVAHEERKRGSEDSTPA